jgi:hypothetical protein
LWYEWPEVEHLHDADREVLLADTFLVAPVLHKEAHGVNITKPPGVWYSYLKSELAKDGEVPVTMWDVPVYIRGGRIAPLYNTPGVTTISTIITPLTLLIAGDEQGESEGSLYLDDGLTYAYEKGEFIHRNFTVKDGVLKSSKADPLESKVPEFLQECRIVNITVYQVQPDQSVKVSHITGLDLKLADEWSYNLKNAIGLRSENAKENGSFTLVISLGIVACAVVAVLCYVWVVRHGKSPLLHEDPMTNSREACHYVDGE